MQIQIQAKPTARLLLRTVTEKPKAQNRRSWVSFDKTSATVTISMNNPQKIISSHTGITQISSLTARKENFNISNELGKKIHFPQQPKKI
jgi:hypothetical protein